MFGRVAFWPQSAAQWKRAALGGGMLALVGVAMSACGFRVEQREPWRAQAENECVSRGEVRPSAVITPMAPIDRGVCGMEKPFRVEALAQGTMGLKSKLVLACPMISMADVWIAEVVQPAAELYFGAGVVEMKAGSYSCRTMNNQRGARMSEHSFGNALDVMSFRLADGREITVLKGWKGPAVEQDFLREVFVGACRYFSTVLGPGADMFHYDHFHMDLARHNPNGTRRICKPAIKFAPRLEPGRPATPVRVPPKLPGLHKPLLPSDDIQNDPFVSDDEMADARGGRAPLGEAPPEDTMVARAYPPARQERPDQRQPVYAPPVAASQVPQRDYGYRPQPQPDYRPAQPVPQPYRPEPGYAPPSQRPLYAQPERPIPPGWIQGPPGREIAPSGRPLDLAGPSGGFTGSGLY